MAERSSQDSGAFASAVEEEGRQVVAPLAPGTYDLVVSAHGFRPTVVHGVRVPSSDVRVGLEPEIGLRGRVLGERVGGFRLSAFEVGDDEEREWTAVDEDGGFFLAVEPGGVRTLVARREGDSRFALLRDAHAGPAALVLELRQGESISGRVPDAPDTTPPSGSDFGTYSGTYSMEPPGFHVYGADGTIRFDLPSITGNRFSLSGLPPGTYMLSGWVRIDGDERPLEPRAGVVAGSRDVELRPR
jgi:hypothetical protein